MKKIIQKIYLFIFNDSKRFAFLTRIGLFNKMGDEKWIKKMYKKTFKRKINLENPKSFNEKLQWLKLNNRNHEYEKMVDKFEVKKYVAKLIGDEYIIPTLGIYNNWDEIKFEKLPKQFVIKCTHDSGSVIICKDKGNFNYKKAKKKIAKLQKKNYYYLSREWPYKNLKSKIIIEPLLIDDNPEVLNDYKILCFNGKPKLIEVHRNRSKTNYTQDFYDINWKKTSISNVGDPTSDEYIKKPYNYKKMVQLSKKLSKDIPHVRVDWYEVNKKLYFGEITFFDGAGFTPFNDYKDDLLLGSWIDLSIFEKGRKT